jgi:hypothetical protein
MITRWAPYQVYRGYRDVRFVTADDLVDKSMTTATFHRYFEHCHADSRVIDSLGLI